MLVYQRVPCPKPFCPKVFLGILPGSFLATLSAWKRTWIICLKPPLVGKVPAMFFFWFKGCKWNVQKKLTCGWTTKIPTMLYRLCSESMSKFHMIARRMGKVRVGLLGSCDQKRETGFAPYWPIDLSQRHQTCRWLQPKRPFIVPELFCYYLREQRSQRGSLSLL